MTENGRAGWRLAGEDLPRGQPRRTVAAKSPPGLALSRLTDSTASLLNMS